MNSGADSTWRSAAADYGAAMVESAADSQSESPRAVDANPGWIGARISDLEAEQREIRAELRDLDTRVGRIEGQLRVIAPAPGGAEPPQQSSAVAQERDSWPGAKAVLLCSGLRLTRGRANSGWVIDRTSCSTR